MLPGYKTIIHSDTLTFQICHSQVTGDEGMKLGRKSAENMEPVCTIEGCALVLPWLRSVYGPGWQVYTYVGEISG